MIVDFDPGKDELNRAKHGLPLAYAARLDWKTAMIRRDTRVDYGEARFQALGYVGIRLHMLVFTIIAQGHIRAISLRKANQRECHAYDRQVQAPSGPA